MHSLIALKFGTTKEHIKVNSGTEFGINLVSIQCVRSDYDYDHALDLDSRADR